MSKGGLQARQHQNIGLLYQPLSRLSIAFEVNNPLAHVVVRKGHF